MKAYLNVLVKIAQVLSTRYPAYRATRHYVGTWEAFNITDRRATRMDGASLTVISAKWPWSRTLDVVAHDIVSGGTREHEGYLVPDPMCPSRRAHRTVCYLNESEVSQQSIEALDSDTLYVIPAEPAYKPHILRRVSSLLALN